MFSAARQSRDPISHGHALFQKPRICALVPGIVVNDKKSRLQKSLPHKPTCDQFYARIQPSNSIFHFLAITCCSFGPIGRPDVLQLPLIASAEYWSKIDSEGTIVGEVVAWVVLPWRLQADAAVAKVPLALLTCRRSCPRTVHCVVLCACSMHQFPRFSPPVSRYPACGSGSRGTFSSCDNRESLQFQRRRPEDRSSDLPNTFHSVFGGKGGRGGGVLGKHVCERDWNKYNRCLVGIVVCKGTNWDYSCRSELPSFCLGPRRAAIASEFSWSFSWIMECHSFRVVLPVWGVTS